MQQDLSIVHPDALWWAQAHRHGFVLSLRNSPWAAFPSRRARAKVQVSQRRQHVNLARLVGSIYWSPLATSGSSASISLNRIWAFIRLMGIFQ